MENIKMKGFSEKDFDDVLTLLTEMWILQGENATVLNADLIKKHYQKQGLGSLLMARVEAYAKEQGVELLTGKIYEFNLPSQKLAMNQGYKKEITTFIKVID